MNWRATRLTARELLAVPKMRTVQKPIAGARLHLLEDGKAAAACRGSSQKASGHDK
jgi:hypothetical protein